MTKTEHYQLPQWEATDPLRREDFNAAFAEMDAAVAAADSRITGVGAAAQAAQAAANAAQAAADAAWSAGNAPYALGQYSGTGKSGAENPCRITVGFRPSALLVCPALAKQRTDLSGDTITPPSHLFAFAPSAAGSSGAAVTWLEDGVSWYGGDENAQCSQKNNTYFYIAFR